MTPRQPFVALKRLRRRREIEAFAVHAQHTIGLRFSGGKTDQAILERSVKGRQVREIALEPPLIVSVLRIEPQAEHGSNHQHLEDAYRCRSSYRNDSEVDLHGDVPCSSGREALAYFACRGITSVGG